MGRQEWESRGDKRAPPPPCMWLGPKTKKRRRAQRTGKPGNSLERQETHTEESPRKNI